MLPEKVREYLDSHREKHLEKLIELVRIPSIANDTSEPDRCMEAATWLAEHLKGLGLDVEILPTKGKPNVLASLEVSADAPTLLIYGHYDVQPADPLELWRTDPFDPQVRDGRLYARGANDDKGQLFTHLMAIEAWVKAGGGVPLNLKVFVEGEEEIGSPNLEEFVERYRERLSADFAVISDSAFFAKDVPSITYSLRGLSYFQVDVHGPSADIHSGLHGGGPTNPINALAKLIAAMHDERGRVAIPGFYDDVLELAPDERKAWDALPFDESQYAESIGLEELHGGERGLPVLERQWARPTLDCNGIVGGYTGKGAKTIIPSSASVKISMRLVPDQDPEKINDAFEKFVQDTTPSGVRVRTHRHAAARPVLLDTAGKPMRAGRNAVLEAFGKEPVMIRCGASVPVTELIQRLLGLDAVLMGFGLPDDNLHSPNEKFDLSQLYNGAVAAAAFMNNLGDKCLE